MLTDTAVRQAKPDTKARKLFDERGLYLEVAPTGGKWWRLKYRFGGKEKRLSLGVYPDISLKIARERRDAARAQIADGIDPSEQRKADKVAGGDTFEAVAREWMNRQIKAVAPNTFRKSEWLLGLLYPHIGNLPIAEIKPAQLLRALRKTEARGKHETAHRARVKASQVFRYAVANGKADRDITTDLKGALTPVSSKNHAAITDPAGIAQLLRAIDDYQGYPAVSAALKLAPLLFARPGELRGMEWGELDFNAREWRIPAARTKMRETHIVPLSKQAISILRELEAVTGPAGLVFPSLRSKARPISDNTLNAALRRMGYAKDEMTAHGFRTVASTRLNEMGFEPDIIERQLAHAERNKVRAAYNKAQHLDKRRAMMQHWADYLEGLKAEKVVSIGKARATA